MTKYILHGGQTSIPNVYNRKFYQEMFRSAKGKPILAAYYSRPRKKWSDLLLSDTKNMRRAVGKKKFEFIMASNQLKEFVKQLNGVEAVYFRGGRTGKLKKKLKNISRKLEKLFAGKTVAGSSAGVCFLSKYYYSNDSRKIERGFGILPIKTYCHYQNDKNNLNKLKKYKEKFPIYVIPETEFVILKK